MNKKHKLRMKISLVGISVFAITLIILSQGLIQPELVGATFTIPVQGAFLTNPNIMCIISDKVHVIDSQGNTIYVTPTDSFSGNPSITYSVIDPKTGKSLAGFSHEPMGFCKSTADVTLHPNLTVIKGYAMKDGKMLEVYSKSYSGGNYINFPVGSTSAKQLMSPSIFAGYAKDIEAKLGSSYSGALEFHMTGEYTVYYTDPKYSSTSTSFWKLIVPELDHISTLVQIQIVSPTSVPDTATRDTDQDGIVDAYDKCLNEKEIFNSYQDGDGCPDTLPTTTTTPTPTVPTCSTGMIYDPSLSKCVPTTPVCPDGSSWDGSKCSGVSLATLGEVVKNAKIISNITYKYTDGTTQQLFSDQLQTTKSGELVLGSITGLPTQQSTKELSSLTVEPFFTLPSLSEAQAVKLTQSSIKFKPVVRVAGTDITLAERQQTGAYATTGTALFGKYFGFSLGKIILTPTELQTQAIQKELVTEGQVRDIILDVNYEGFFNIEKSGTSGVVTVGKSYIEFTTFQINNVASAHTQTCNQTGERLVVNNDGTVSCVKDSGVDNTVKDSDVDGVADTVDICPAQKEIINGYRDTDGCPDTAPSTNDSCTLGMSGCDICVDDNRVGGFPCTKDYRDTYCDGTTSCEVTSPACTGTTCVTEPKVCPTGYIMNTSGKCITTGSTGSTACPTGQLRNENGLCETPKLPLDCPDEYAPSTTNDYCVYTGVSNNDGGMCVGTDCDPDTDGGLNNSKIGKDLSDIISGKISIGGIPVIVLIILFIMIVIIIGAVANRKKKQYGYS